MPTAYKVLGQVAPAATTDTTLYTCPASTETVISTISVCNRSTSAATFRIAVRPDAAAISNEHYIVYDAVISGTSTATFTIGMTINASDVITVRASAATISFSAFGSEIT